MVRTRTKQKLPFWTQKFIQKHQNRSIQQLITQAKPHNSLTNQRTIQQKCPKIFSQNCGETIHDFITVGALNFEAGLRAFLGNIIAPKNTMAVFFFRALVGLLEDCKPRFVVQPAQKVTRHHRQLVKRIATFQRMHNL